MNCVLSNQHYIIVNFCKELRRFLMVGQSKLMRGQMPGSGYASDFKAVGMCSKPVFSMQNSSALLNKIDNN